MQFRTAFVQTSLPFPTTPRMTATTPPTPRTPHQTTSTPTVRSATPLLQRPELVGALPLWLLASGAAQVRRFANALSTGRTAGGAASSTTKVESDANVGEVLRSVARSVDGELAHARAQLDAKDERIEKLMVEKEVLEERLRSEREKLECVEEGVETLQLRLTVAQLRVMASREQSKAAAAEIKLRRVSDVIGVLQREREDSRQDFVKLSLLGMGLFVVFVAFLVRSPLTEGVVRSLVAGV